MIKARNVAIATIGLLVLAGCQQNQETAKPPLLNGKWADANGIATAEFNNGTFTSIANDTGAVVATGTYFARSEAEVTINWTGNISQKQNTAQCNRTPKQMQCTDKDGRTFTLNRQA